MRARFANAGLSASRRATACAHLQRRGLVRQRLPVGRAHAEELHADAITVSKVGSTVLRATLDIPSQVLIACGTALGIEKIARIADAFLSAKSDLFFFAMW